MCICSTFYGGSRKIPNIAQPRLAPQVSSSRVDLDKFVAFRDCRKRREFSTSVRRFSYSVISERPASSGRVAFRARVVQCSILVFARTSRFRVETFPLFSNILEYLSFRNENVSVVGMLSGAPLTFFYVGGKRKGKAKKHSFHFLARIAF